MKIFNKNEWKKVKLGDVCDILDSKRIPISEEKRIKGEYPYYGANGIQGYINDYIFDEELVLLAEDGGNFGSKTKPIAYKISGKTWINNHAHVLKAKDEIISTDFLLYSLMFYDVTKLITGTTRKKLTRAGMEKITLSIPTLSIQNKITDYLQKIESFISFRKHQLNSLKELNKSLFTTMFGDIKTNDKNWKLFEIKEISNIITRGKTPKYASSSNIFVINQACIYWDKLKYENVKFHIEDESLLFLKNKDVLINSTGTGTLGRMNIIQNIIHEKFTIDSHVMLIRLKAEKTLPLYFINIFMNEKYQKDLLLKCVNGSTNQIELSKEKFSKFKIPVPPIELQNKFAERIEKIEKLKFEIEKSIETAQNLYDSLISKYFDN
jgi:type I restriction-modification system, S subunit (fragment)